MSVSIFEAFKAELGALREAILVYPQKIVRDEELRERIRTLFRTWTYIVQPSIEYLLQSRREFLKLHAEVEALAKLTSKLKPVTEYRKRLTKSIELSNRLVLNLPPLGQTTVVTSHGRGDDLFIPGIPDIPAWLVPNSIFGWKSKLEAFLNQRPFDRSIFIMVRYRRLNRALVSRIKAALAKNGFYGVLASEHNLTDDLYNPIACLLCCSRGLAVFDRPESGQTFNPNVAYELGTMHLLGRDCLILKHTLLKVLHADILMKLYLEYKTVNQAEKHINNWLTSAD